MLVELRVYTEYCVCLLFVYVCVDNGMLICLPGLVMFSVPLYMRQVGPYKILPIFHCIKGGRGINILRNIVGNKGGL